MKLAQTLLWVVGPLLLCLWLVGCATAPEPCPQPTPCPECPKAACAPCPAVEAAVACPACPECPAATTASPFESQWASSAHADKTAEAFTHWDDADPSEIPPECARCHSTPGYEDYLGADGSAVGVVDKPAPIGTVITCDACHNQAAIDLKVVPFPSGITVTVEGPQARCMVCHQGGASTRQVNESIAAAGLTDDDTVSPDLGFTNIHYKAAAATLYGTRVKGGYEYEGKAYDGKFDHIEGMDSCVQCHDMHTLQLRTETCGQCHTQGNPKDVRMMGSQMDYDGDGNVAEGIYYEIEGLRDMLYQGIQAYAQGVSKTPIVYDPAVYPYFFIDTSANGQLDEGEATFANQYNAWTGRLAKAAYNYQTSLKDPGAYAHGGKYIIELLYDSIDSLNQALAAPIDLSNAHRIDDGHFAGSELAFRNWDEEGVVPGLCSRCHTAKGLPQYITEGVTTSQPPSSGLNCATCHNDLTTFTIYKVPWVRFPRGTLIDTGDPASNLCLNCHQGLSSIATVNGAIAGKDLDTVATDLEFINIHYFAAAATLFGTEVQGAYEYSAGPYHGRNIHVEAYRNCTQCHDIHRQDVKVQECGACHPGVRSRQDLFGIRMDSTDYDGDGNTSEGIAGEIDTMRTALYAAIVDYAAAVVRTPIVYEPNSYPYFFTDTNGDGQADPAEAVYDNRYATWTPRLLRAAYNYQYAMKDPGAFAHNPKYVLQVLYDTLADLGGDVSGMTRPSEGKQ